MPRSLTFHNAIAAITIAVASLCGGGKAVAEQKGTLSIVEVRGDATLRPDARKRAGKFLRDWLQARRPDWVVRTKSGDPVAIWSPDGVGETLSDLPEAADIAFHEVAEADQSDLKAGRAPDDHIIVPDANHPELLFAVKSPSLLNSDDVTIATQSFDQNGHPVVAFRFSPEAGKIFGRWTQKSVGQPFAIVVDGEVISAPIIREPILGGSGQISGYFTVEEANSLALRLTSSLEGVDFVIAKTCPAARPRAPPNKVLAWLTPIPTCE